MQRKFRPGVCPQEVYFLTGDNAKSTTITNIVPSVLMDSAEVPFPAWKWRCKGGLLDGVIRLGAKVISLVKQAG